MIKKKLIKQPILIFLLGTLILICTFYKTVSFKDNQLFIISYSKEQLEDTIHSIWSGTESPQAEFHRRMEYRRQTLINGCRRFRNKTMTISNIPLKMMAKKYLVNEKEKLLSCPVYKAGSSYLHHIIAILANATDLLGSRTYLVSKYLKTDEKTLLNIMKHSSEWTSLVQTRDPLKRLVSAYLDRITDISHGSWQAAHYVPLILQHSRKIRYSHEELFYKNNSVKIIPTFKEFASYITTVLPSQQALHWKPITLLCFPCSFSFKYILQMETLMKDMTFISRELGIEEKVGEYLQTFSNKGKSNTTEKLVEFYTSCGPELLHKILRIYKYDFLILGYDPTNFVNGIFPSMNLTIKDLEAF